MKNFSFKTKKSFHQSSDRIRTYGTAVFYVIIALLCVFFFRSVIGNLTSGSVGVLMNMRNYFESSGATLPTYLRSRGELVAKILSLEEQIAAQSGDNATIARLGRENEELRMLLGDTKDERILAGVIARPPSTPYDLLMIDRGARDGIVKDAIVYHSSQHAVGMISRVYETTSLVTLFSSSGVESTVYVYGPDVFAYAYGEGGGVIRISLPQGILVHEGDVVVLPSLHMGDLGIVERVVSVPTEPEQNAYLTFPIPIQSLRSVTVSKTAMTIPPADELIANVEELRAYLRIDVPDSFRLGTATTSAFSIQGGQVTSTVP